MNNKKYLLEQIKNNFVVFGDSHSRCFSTLIKNVNSFSASSAKGLGNSQSISQTNIKIKEVCKKKYLGYIFFFGKVDIDCILTYMLNTKPDIDFISYLDSIITNYTNFIKELSINNVYICELTISHLSDKDLLKINNNVRTTNINSHLSEKFNLIQYDVVFPYTIRNEYVFYFNNKLKEFCDINNYTLLKINNNFLTNGNYEIPNNYLYKNILDHHLVENVLGESYLKQIIDESKMSLLQQKINIYNKKNIILKKLRI